MLQNDSWLTPEVKRKLSVFLVIFIFIAYYIGTDPDTSVLVGIPFGTGIILTLQIFIVSISSILMVEFLPDFFIDVIYGKESLLREKAAQTSHGAGTVMMAKSIRILAYSFIIAASIISYNIG